MRKRTVALVAASAATVGAASIGAATATLLGRRADEQHHRALMALSKAFFTVPWDREPPVTLPEPGRHLRPVR